MSNHVKDNIIIPAWNIVKNDSNLKKFYLLPGILSIIFLSALLVYQSIYTYVEIIGKKEETLIIILNFFHSDYLFEVVIIAVIFLIFYFLLSPIYEGGLIKYIQDKNTKNELNNSDAFLVGLYNFFPLFEYNNLFSEFKFISVLNGYLFIVRFVGIEYIQNISYVFLVIFFFSIILNVLFAYSKYIIILEEKKVFESIGESSKIAMMNLSTTIRLYFLMFFLNIRVIINFILFLSFPLLAVVLIGVVTSKIFLLVAITILVVIFIGLIGVLGYLTAVLDIFKTSLWYFAYKAGKEKMEKIKDSS
ncbi:hypothetical protein A9Q91_05740 [Candidatus Gracilibacteria bacterium 28_42_T64]|nr:hypothetical protein A9Q91_05740 [Candidatus Gracilibacteria bacterium 28_42_T64]